MKLYNPENTEKFFSWCREMYYINGDERQAYKQPVITFDEYMEIAGKFLMDKYKAKDGLGK